MDPADAAPVLRELSVQGEMLERHEKMMKHVVEEQTVLRQLVAELKGILLTPPGAAADAPPPGQSLSTAAASPLPPSPPTLQREHPLPAPEKFSGDLDKSRGFLTQCSFIFREQPRSYFSDGAKVGLMVESMTGRALQWAQAVVSMQPAISYEDFLCKFRCVFDKGSSADSAAHRMFSLKQGWRSVADFSIDFWILAEETGWQENALRGAFINGLNENLKRELASRELPKSLSALVNVCIQLDEHRREFGRRPAGGSKTSAGPSLEWRREWEEQPLEEEQPMQIGRASFRSVARRRRPQGGECFTCGKRGHFSDKCPESGKDAARQ